MKIQNLIDDDDLLLDEDDSEESDDIVSDDDDDGNENDDKGNSSGQPPRIGFSGYSSCSIYGCYCRGFEGFGNTCENCGHNYHSHY